MGERVLPNWPAAMPADLAAAYVGLSVATMYANIDKGRFPDPIPLSDRRKGWRRTDLDRWVEQGGVSGEGGATVEANPWDK